MHHTLARAAALCALLAATSALGATRTRRIMLLDIPPDENFKPSVTKVLNDFLAGSLHDQGFEVVTAADITAVLGVERQKQLLGCAESSCLAEIGGAMGADYIVRGNVAVLDSDTAVTLSLVDSKGKPINLGRKLVGNRSSKALVQALEEMVPPLVAPIRPAPAAAAGAQPAGGLQASAEAKPAGGGSKVGAYALLGVGGVSLITSGVMGYRSYSDYQAYNAAARSGDDLGTYQKDANLKGAVAWGTLGVGLVAAAVGTYLLLSGD